jgi:DNA polymerase-3 subunit gamma/tau
LRAVVEGEGRQADDEALELVARRAAGSMRDAQSLLDQLLAFGGDRLTAEQVHRLLGTAADDQVAALAAAVLARDPQQALALLEQGLSEGLQPGELVDQLIEYWADLMRVASAGPEYPHLSAGPRLRETLRQQGTAAPLDSVLAGLDVLTTTKARLRGSNHGRVLLEMALIRLGRLDDLVSLTQLAQALSQPDAGQPTARPMAPTGNAARAVGTAGAVRPASDPAASADVKKNSPALTDADPTPLTTETLAQVWSEVFAQVGNLHAAQLGKAGLPAISGPNTLVLRFDVAYNHEWTFCSDAARIQRVQDALRKVTDEPWTVRIETAVMRNGPTAQQPVTNGLPVVSDRVQRQREALQDPLLQQAKDVLGAKAIHVDEGFGSPSQPVPERSNPELPDPEEL